MAVGHAANVSERVRTAKLAQGEAVVLLNQRQRRLIQSAAGSARKGADCWQRLASLGVCRLGEARAGPAGGIAP